MTTVWLDLFCVSDTDVFMVFWCWQENGAWSDISGQSSRPWKGRNCDKTDIPQIKKDERTFSIQLARSCSLSLSSSSRKHLSHFCAALPAASHTVSLDFPQEHSEGSRFIGTQQGTEVAWLSGSISCTSQRPRQKTYSPPTYQSSSPKLFDSHFLLILMETNYYYEYFFISFAPWQLEY